MKEENTKPAKAGTPNKVGRPSRYLTAYAQLAYNYCLLGATDKEMAEFFGVSEQTLNTWKQRHPEFLESLKREISSDSAVDRMRALKRIGEGFEPTHRDDVVSMLCLTVDFDPNPVVRHEAAFLISDLTKRGLIGAGPDGRDRGLEALLDAAFDGSVLVRHEVALSLAAFDHPAAKDTLRRMLQDCCGDVRVSAELAIEERGWK